MSKAKLSFIEQLEADIKKSEKQAEVIKETQVVNIKPLFTDSVTQESLNEHLEFINYQGAIVNATTSNTAFENFEEVGDKPWTGVMDLGELKITAHTRPRDVVDDNNFIYGQTDLFFDHHNSTELQEWYSSFAKADSERCENLFKD